MLVSRIKMQQEIITNATKDTSRRRPHEERIIQTQDHTRRETKETYYKNFYNKGPQLYTVDKTITQSQWKI